MVFSKIIKLQTPDLLTVGKDFEVVMHADGEVPFPQLILRQEYCPEWVSPQSTIQRQGDGVYRFTVPAGAFVAGTVWLQLEGCKLADISRSSGEDWIKAYAELHAFGAEMSKSTAVPEANRSPKPRTSPKISLGRSSQPVIYFGIHKHMHQPYYDATDVDYWDGEKEDIFASRSGPYTHFIPTAVAHYINGGLGHAGLSTSWSSSLIEQLNRCAGTGRAHGHFANWSEGLRRAAREKTAFGNPRVTFTAFGSFHPLMALLPERDIIGQIEWHRQTIQENFGVPSSDLLFPPETAFAPHMIPALTKAGINITMYDSIHHYRACQDYPYAGPSEGMLPPNEADQLNPPVPDWTQLTNVWAPSKIAPSLLKPCMLVYTDRHGEEHRMIGVPAERYLGNEDARGGYGALQYESVMGQLYDSLVQSGAYDPEHPPFFLLHSDGDNYGGGAESYYNHNTAQLVQMCQNDPRFQLITVHDYLQQFPVDPANKVHVEAGSWAGADNGDPQFTKWFSWAEKDYSPDLNSWAVLTAFQNIVHSMEDSGQDQALCNQLKRLLYTAETSCYWYWTGIQVWDAQVTNAANRGLALAGELMAQLGQIDTTGPTIFVPWVRPANPGGKDWGNNCLKDAAKEATINTFVYDLCGIETVRLCYRTGKSEQWHQLSMQDKGLYPSQTNPAVIANHYQTILPAGSGDVEYYIDAVDNKGNRSESPLARVYIV